MRTNLDLREQTMTSLEIAELTGKPHNDVLKAIRKMEPAWTQVTQGKFSLSSYQDAMATTKEMGFMRQPLLILIIDLQDVFHQIRSHFFQWQGGSEQGHHFPLLVVNGLEIGGEQAPACYARNKVVL